MIDYDILMVGNFAKDKIIIDGIESTASGGGVYFGSVVIKRLGLNVAVVTRLHPDDFIRLEELIQEGVDVFAEPASGTSGIANYYNSGDMERRICKPIGFGGKFSLEQIPEFRARLIMLSPLYAGEVDLSILKNLSTRAPVAMDIQGFVRVPVESGLEFRPWDDLAEGLKYVKFLKVDKAEAEFLTGESDLHKSIELLHEMGPDELVLTQSSGITAYANGKTYHAPFTPKSLLGRTGRGDTCFSTYCALRMTEDPETACRWAGVVTSQKQETPGPWKGTRQQVEHILMGQYEISNDDERLDK